MIIEFINYYFFENPYVTRKFESYELFSFKSLDIDIFCHVVEVDYWSDIYLSL